jgi:hypothetical protein
MISRTLAGIAVLLILICSFATPAVCQDAAQGADGEPFMSLLALFGVVGLAAAVAALAIRMVRRSQ